jgi:hypothetical protein
MMQNGLTNGASHPSLSVLGALPRAPMSSLDLVAYDLTRVPVPMVTFAQPQSLPLRPQNRELLVADGIGNGRFDRGNPRAGWPLGAPREKGVNCPRVAFDVDQHRAVRLVAHPTGEAAMACLALCRRSVFDALYLARDASDDPHPRLMRHADSLV